MAVSGPGIAGAAVARAESFLELIEKRSPGNRTGAHLTKTKHQRIALHERALPKVRGPAPSAYEALTGPAPTLPLAPPSQAPLFTAVAGGPKPIIPLAGGPSGGPPILSDIPPPGGGGGGFTPPTVTTLEVPPAAPPTGVPEPATWAMMLIGFAAMGWQVRREQRPARAAAA